MGNKLTIPNSLTIPVGDKYCYCCHINGEFLSIKHIKSFKLINGQSKIIKLECQIYQCYNGCKRCHICFIGKNNNDKIVNGKIYFHHIHNLNIKKLGHVYLYDNVYLNPYNFNIET
jgi:hypothetical protein